jgi:hypothetical protein
MCAPGQAQANRCCYSGNGSESANGRNGSQAAIPLMAGMGGKLTLARAYLAFRTLTSFSMRTVVVPSPRYWGGCL